MLRGKVEGEMALLSDDSSVKQSPEDKHVSVPCVKGSARRVTLALYTGLLPHLDALLQLIPQIHFWCNTCDFWAASIAAKPF